MVTYNFDFILGQQVSLAPAADQIRFETNEAIDVSLATSGVTLVMTTANGSVTFDATPQEDETSFAMLGLSNVVFTDGSKLAIGDLLADDDNDDSGNVIDFTTDAQLLSALGLNNQVHGLGGGDTINLTGGDGHNILFGGGDSDTISAGNGNNTIFGGESFADTADGGDTIVLGHGNNVIYANAGDDAVTFSSPTQIGGYLLFYGGSGGDSLTASNAAGRFELYGGPGGDTLSLINAAANNTLYGGGGGDTIDMSGSYGENTIFGGDSFADTADGGDAITLGGGNNTLYANAGADTVTANASGGSTANIFLGSGADILTSGNALGTYVIYAGPDADSVDLTNHNGNATIFGGNGAADSTDGADTIVGSSSGSIVVYGNAGADDITVTPSASNSALVYAGAGDDTITAAPGATSSPIELYGNTGNDTFAISFASAESILNIKDYSTGTNSMEVTLSGGASASSLSLVHSNGNSVISRGSAEQIVLEGFTGNFSDSFEVSDESVLETNLGNDAATLSGTDNGDYLIAGNSGDTLEAGAGDDKLIGGGGNDVFEFATADINNVDTVKGGAGTDTIALDSPDTGIFDFAFANKSFVEVLELTTGDFSTGVTMGNNASSAGIFSVDATGASTVTIDMSGMTNGVLYRGGTDSDIVTSTNHNDAIDGKAGDDTITGNQGNDTILSGDGEDVLAYNFGGGDGSDVIGDFDFGTATESTDILQFAAGAGGYNLGNLDAVVDGAIITSITSAGASGTELIILKSIGIATTDISTQLDIINADVSSDKGALNLFFDTTLGQAVMYYDLNGRDSGGHQQLIRFSNIDSLDDMSVIDFTDFEFV